MPAATSIAIGGAAVLGGVAGAMGNHSSQSQSSGVNVAPASAQEQVGQQGMMDAYGQLQNFSNLGPGAKDVTAGYNAQTSLADQLAQMQKSGGMPGANDIGQANNMAGQLFGAQRVGLQQSMLDQTNMANRQAALSGRSANDPVLRAKLAQEQMRQGSMLDAQQNSYGQQLAMQLPQNRLQYAGQRAGVLGGLATQAMQNRQAIAAMGEGIMNNERNWRLQTASRWGQQSQDSGGGLAGGISGALAGAGAGMGIAKGFGGGGTTAPTGGPSTGFFSGPNPYSSGFTSASGAMGGNGYSLSGNASYGGGSQPSLFGSPMGQNGVGTFSGWKN